MCLKDFDQEQEVLLFLLVHQRLVLSLGLQALVVVEVRQGVVIHLLEELNMSVLMDQLPSLQLVGCH
jgi:hypothetical protein